MKPRTIVFQPGQQVGLLTVISDDPNRRYHLICRCDCGVVKSVRKNDIHYGRTISCGCEARRRTREIAKGNTYALTHGMSRTRTYRTWDAMRSRCRKTNKTNFARYYARGIKVCERWQSFENFYADMGEHPPGLTLERIDNDGDYTPENCRWATVSEQAMNRHTTKFVTIEGETHKAFDLAKIAGVKADTIVARAAAGLPFHKVTSREKLKRHELRKSAETR